MFNIQEELKKVPEKPGVYIMKDKYGEIIYIGKAIILKNRIRQYFQSLSNQSPKVQAMVPKIAEFEYIVTDSELEALILECNLIKKHKPRFNILLKDDKNYPYIKVTMNEEYPRILMTRRMEKDGAKYFGPYSNAGAVRQTIDLLKKLFPVKTCRKVLPRDIGKERPCLNYHIYQCLGPCQGDVNKEEYRALMKDICSFLGGRQDEIIKRLESQMKKAADELDFERAANIRNKMISLKHISEKQKVLSTAMEDQDVIAFAKGQADACIQVFFIRGGKLIGREHFILDSIGQVEDKELMTSFIKQFYTSAAYIPGEIILQEDIDEINLIERWLSGKRESKVYIKVPRKGDKLKLVEMVAQNAHITLNQFKEKLKGDDETIRKALETLGKIVGLEDPPARIEAYDISNIGTADTVGSMVVFKNGKPAKSEYRRFKIKSIEGQNDYASMQEVVYRRLKRAIEGGQQQNDRSSDSFNQLPDLILVDGGVGHVNAVKDVLKELQVNIPVWGMVKNEKHRTHGLVSGKEEVNLASNLPVFRLVTAIQDEAHRFALEYSKRLRMKRYRGSVLDEIEGVGAKRKKALLSHFGSIKKIREAEIEELLKVKGINRAVAEKIYEYFKD